MSPSSLKRGSKLARLDEVGLDTSRLAAVAMILIAMLLHLAVALFQGLHDNRTSVRMRAFSAWMLPLERVLWNVKQRWT